MSDLVAKQTFEEKMKNRIRESIGDLIDDEQLKSMIDRSIEDLFFKEHKVVTEYGHVKRIDPPLINGILSDLMTATMQAHVEQWTVEHADQINGFIMEAVQKGAGQFFVSAMSFMFQREFSQFGEALITRIQENRT